jgi:hypothetical protein
MKQMLLVRLEKIVCIAALLGAPYPAISREAFRQK